MQLTGVLSARGAVKQGAHLVSGLTAVMVNLVPFELVLLVPRIHHVRRASYCTAQGSSLHCLRRGWMTHTQYTLLLDTAGVIASHAGGSGTRKSIGNFNVYFTHHVIITCDISFLPHICTCCSFNSDQSLALSRVY